MKVNIEEELNGFDYHFDSYRRNIGLEADKILGSNKNDSVDIAIKKKSGGCYGELCKICKRVCDLNDTTLRKKKRQRSVWAF